MSRSGQKDRVGFEPDHVIQIHEPHITYSIWNLHKSDQMNPQNFRTRSNCEKTVQIECHFHNFYQQINVKSYCLMMMSLTRSRVIHSTSFHIDSRGGERSTFLFALKLFSLSLSSVSRLRVSALSQPSHSFSQPPNSHEQTCKHPNGSSTPYHSDPIGI